MNVSEYLLLKVTFGYSTCWHFNRFFKELLIPIKMYQLNMVHSGL